MPYLLFIENKSMVYTYLKLFHILAVVVFLGNIIATIFWLHYSVRSKDENYLQHTLRGIKKTDRWFTLPSVIILFIGGLGAAMHGKLPIFGTGWILWSIVLLLVSGFAFSAKLAPIQRKMLKITEIRSDKPLFDDPGFTKLLNQWNLWAFIALITPVIAFVMMVLRHPA